MANVNNALIAYEQARKPQKYVTSWVPDDAPPEEMEYEKAVFEAVLDSFYSVIADKEAPVYAIDHLVIDACLGAVDTFPDDFRWVPELTPTESGFMYFNRPVPYAMPDASEGHREDLRWLFWEPGFTYASKEEQYSGKAPTIPGITLIFGIHCYIDHQTMIRNVGWWGFEKEISEALSLSKYQADATWTSMALLVSLWLFMQQKVAVTHPARLSRNVYKRALMRTGKEPPALRIVKLRAAEHAIYERGESEGREWSMRWVVRGHWRNQWYPKRKAHSPVWIAPYVKGPEGLPLIGARKVFDVSR